MMLIRKPKKISTINLKGMDGVPRHDLGIVIEDWKTKIGRKRGEMRIVRRREMTVEEDL